MVSLQKKEMVIRESVPVHLLSEEAAQIAVKANETPNVPAAQTAYIAVGTNDLTALSKSELCTLMRETADKMSVDYALIERITSEAQRRASTEDHGGENYWGDVDYFQYGLAKKIINGHRLYRKRHRFDCSFSVVLDVVRIFILVGMFIGFLILAGNVILPALFALLALFA